MSLKGEGCEDVLLVSAIEIIRKSLYFQSLQQLLSKAMRRHRSFEENPIQNFEIEQQFEKLMQIDGLTQSKGGQQDLYPSLKGLFQSQAPVSIIGSGPNANIRAFNYLLLCHIRKVHITRLLEDQHQQEVDRLDREEGPTRDRKVSFNDRGALFLKGPQYENYALHKLKIYSFSSTTDLNLIKNSPFQWDSSFKFKGQRLTSDQLKKLLSEFLSEILPMSLSQDYKTNVKSVRHFLNHHHVASVILTMVMRHVLFNSYQLQAAENFQEQLSDHTVCTALCDAFAINGLICKDNLYQINTWCKVYSIYNKGNVIFVEMFNDQFEEMGLLNDIKGGKCRFKKSHTFGQEEGEGRTDGLKAPEMEMSEMSSSLKKDSQCSVRSSDGSGSMMDNDEDSQIPSSRNSNSGQLENEGQKITFKEDLKKEENVSSEHSNINNEGFRSTFSSKQMEIVKQIQAKCSQSREETHQPEIQTDRIQPPPHQIETSFQKKSFCQLSFSKGDHPTEPRSTKTPLRLDQSSYNSSGWIPLQRIVLPKPRSKLACDSSHIVNNNINNNIYLSLGEKGQYRPIINISTGQKKSDTINIKLT